MDGTEGPQAGQGRGLTTELQATIHSGMLYLISGASRAGKTIVAERILQARGIPYLSLDWLVMGFTNGMPQAGIHDKLMPDEIATGIWPFFKAMCASMIWQGIDYVIEGEAMLPENIRELVDAHPGKIKVCFLGYADVDTEEKLKAIHAHSAGGNDWLTKEEDAYIRDHIGNMVRHSRLIRDGCERHNLRYIETSGDFPQAIEEAAACLLDA